MSPSESLAKYAADLANLRRCFDDEKHDRDAYAHFGEALDLAMEGARRAAEAYVKAERAGLAPKERKAVVDRRRRRVAAIFADGVRAAARDGLAGGELTDVVVQARAAAYAAGKVPA